MDLWTQFTIDTVPSGHLTLFYGENGPDVDDKKLIYRS